MSGIYIPNMAYPKVCGECPFFVDEDIEWCGRCNYNICDGLVDREGKPDWCDLVAVPDADVQPTPRWISVEERLPEKSGHYLAVINGETGEASYFGHESHSWLDPVEELEDWTRFVSHWMPLPEPTKEET